LTGTWGKEGKFRHGGDGLEGRGFYRSRCWKTQKGKGKAIVGRGGVHPFKKQKKKKKKGTDGGGMGWKAYAHCGLGVSFSRSSNMFGGKTKRLSGKAKLC